jgi:hypothetical protein
MKLPTGDCPFRCCWADGSGHVGMTVPDVKAALARFEKLGVEVFKPLGVATNATIPVPDGMTTIVPGFQAVYKQIAMIRVFCFKSRVLMAGSGWIFHRIGSSEH